MKKKEYNLSNYICMYFNLKFSTTKDINISMW